MVMANNNDDELMKDTKEALKDVGYSSDGDPWNVINLEQYVKAGLKSSDYIELVCKLASYVEFRSGAEMPTSQLKFHQYEQNGNTTGILLMLSKLLPSLGCPHACLIDGPVRGRLNTKRARLLLLHFLASEAKYFGAADPPVIVNTVKELKEVIETGEGFIASDEVMRSREYQIYRAGRDEDKLENEKKKEMRDAAAKKKKENQMKKSDVIKLINNAKEKSTLSTAESSLISTATKSTADAKITVDARICWNCHAKENLVRCGGCEKAWYCDKECQMADRARHKKYCKIQKRIRIDMMNFGLLDGEVD